MPAIEFYCPLKKELHKDKVLKFELYINPTIKQSLLYKLAVPVFAQSTPEELLLLIRAIYKVVNAQNATVELLTILCYNVAYRVMHLLPLIRQPRKLAPKQTSILRLLCID